jgi:peroxiredoxin Q/BCP
MTTSPVVLPGPRVGDTAPNFALKDQAGRLRRLRDFAGRDLVLYFYPKDDTPGCTTQACGFRDAWSRLTELDAAVVGISPDSVESHAAFVAKHRLPFTLLSDPPGRVGVPKVALAYGVWREKILYGRRSIGLVRTTFVIDGEGIVVGRFDQVRAPGHAERIAEFLDRRRRGR